MRHIRNSMIAMIFISIFLPSCKKDEPEQLIVDAGSTRYIQLPKDTATLTGTVTSGQTASMHYLWTLISGSGSPSFVSNTSASTVVEGLVEGTYVFQFQATNSDGNIAVDTTSLTVLSRDLITNTITIQPGIFTGQDARVLNISGNENMNFDTGTIEMATWTYSSLGQGNIRSFFKFTALDTLPAGAVITSAKLSLFAPTNLAWPGYIGNSYYPGSPYNSFGDNKGWLQRCTQNWDRKTVTYNNKPSVTSTNAVVIPASTSQYDYSITDLDVTELVKDMKTSPGTNFGFSMQLQNEAIYRDMRFDGSDAKSDSSTGPKLVITYSY